MTIVYYAAPENSFGSKAMMTWDWDQRPLAVLTSYFYHSLWTKMQAGPTPIRPCKVMLDSGAYSAYQLGKTIDLEAFVEAAKAPGWDEVVSLDVIGDAEASVRNAERIAKLGLPDAMPVFHIGDPWEHLDHYCAGWKKVGLSCRFGEPVKTSIQWLEKCFARAYPHRFHSFGYIAVNALIRFPFHSADASSWTIGSINRNMSMGGQFGRTRSLNVRGADTVVTLDIVRTNIMAQYRLEQQLQTLWGKELAKL